MFQCSQCSKSYQRKTHLLRHQTTHTSQLSSSCPFCKKSFQKPEVTRRHSKGCAKKHNLPLPPANKPGRKRLSCEACFAAKAACDRNSPCSRCFSLGKQCTLADQGIQIQEVSPSAIVLSPPVVGNPRNLPKGDGLFSFLRHFASPSVKIDRLAIGETANLSIRRNLEALHSHLEDALIPTNAMSGFMVDPRIAEFSMRLTSSTDYLLSEYPNEALFPSKLSNQLMELMEELVEASRSMSDGETQQPLDMTDLATMLGASNISNFISAFFQSLHWHLPVVHFPTFDPGNVSSPLLLAISLAGAAYSLPLDGASFSPWILDVAEEYIFRKISNLSANSSPTDPCHLIPTVQLIQSALIMEMLQFGRDDMQVRRRIRITRHPCLVSTIRSFGIFKLKRRTAPKECDEWTWKVLVAEEMCIRISCWVFLADGFLTVCFKNHPALSVFEMDCDFPWSSELWEAEDAASFSHIAAARLNQPALPSLKKVIEQLLETPKTAASMSWSTSLSPEHLLILIYAMSSLAFQARSGLFKYLSLETISQAAANWKRIWDAAVNSLDQQKFLHLGYPKHAEELWWLLNATLNATGNQDKTFSYLDNTATDELGNLNEFIQWCQRST